MKDIQCKHPPKQLFGSLKSSVGVQQNLKLLKIFLEQLGKEQIWGRFKVKQFGDKVKGAMLRFLNVGCCVASV